MHSCMCYRWSTHLWALYIFILRLSVRPFLGLVDEAASTSIFILLCPSHLSICLVWFCLFLQNAFTTPWPFIKKWGLQSILEGSHFDFYVRCFPEEAPQFPADFSFTVHFCAICWDFLPSNLLGGLFSSCLVVSCVQTGQSLGGSNPFFRVPLMVQYLQRFWIGLLATARDAQGSLLSALYFTNLITEKVSTGCFSYLQWDFVWSHLYSCFVRSRG